MFDLAIILLMDWMKTVGGCPTVSYLILLAKNKVTQQKSTLRHARRGS